MDVEWSGGGGDGDGDGSQSPREFPLEGGLEGVRWAKKSGTGSVWHVEWS